MKLYRMIAAGLICSILFGGCASTDGVYYSDEELAALVKTETMESVSDSDTPDDTPSTSPTQVARRLSGSRSAILSRGFNGLRLGFNGEQIIDDGVVYSVKNKNSWKLCNEVGCSHKKMNCFAKILSTTNCATVFCASNGMYYVEGNKLYYYDGEESKELYVNQHASSVAEEELNVTSTQIDRLIPLDNDRLLLAGMGFASVYNCTGNSIEKRIEFPGSVLMHTTVIGDGRYYLCADMNYETFMIDLEEETYDKVADKVVGLFGVEDGYYYIQDQGGDRKLHKFTMENGQDEIIYNGIGYYFAVLGDDSLICSKQGDQNNLYRIHDQEETLFIPEEYKSDDTELGAVFYDMNLEELLVVMDRSVGDPYGNIYQEKSYLIYSYQDDRFTYIGGGEADEKVDSK